MKAGNLYTTVHGLGCVYDATAPQDLGVFGDV